MRSMDVTGANGGSSCSSSCVCSDVHKQVHGTWSPDGRHLAAAAGNRLLVREAEGLKLVQVFVCAGKIERVSWAPDSQHLLAEVPKQAIVDIWYLRDGDWHCRIDAGLAGAVRAIWAPTSTHVLVISDFQLYVSVWCLVDRKSVAQVPHPKFASRGLAFSASGRWLAVLRRVGCRDWLSVLSCETDGAARTTPFETIADVALVDGSDCADLAWAPGDAALVFWDRPSRSPRFLWYNPCGELLVRLDDGGLARRVCPSPSRQFFAAASFDGCVHLVSGAARRLTARLVHDLAQACAEAGEDEVQLLQQQPKSVATTGQSACYAATSRTAAIAGALRNLGGGDISASASAHVSVTTDPSSVALDADGFCRVGVSSAEWSPGERYLATRHDSAPAVVWVWDVGRLALRAVLMHCSPVRAFSWNPSKDTTASASEEEPRLAIATAEDGLCLWTASTATSVGESVACPVAAGRLEWRRDGRAVLLQDRDRACVCWMAPSRTTAGSGGESLSTATAAARMGA
eukprot:TRINITY_DN37790_c0_g1_i1.p1 TRINITY_DN37790_c0_g1~~TRINITY_DN37790_c0_g1_i1.p1  ORF type:complete len:516 (-),score=66.16 TRINITY_DN37790_c0_g1_i1:88-1635(-)